VDIDINIIKKNLGNKPARAMRGRHNKQYVEKTTFNLPSFSPMKVQPQPTKQFPCFSSFEYGSAVNLSTYLQPGPQTGILFPKDHTKIPSTIVF